MTSIWKLWKRLWTPLIGKSIFKNERRYFLMNLEVGIRWMELFNEKVQNEKDYLTQLDTPIGDSDHGNNMSRGMAHVVEAIEEQQPENLNELLKLVTTNLISKVGRVKCPLYASTIMVKMRDEAADEEWQMSSKVGLVKNQISGKTETSELTIVDVRIVVVESVSMYDSNHAIILT